MLYIASRRREPSIRMTRNEAEIKHQLAPEAMVSNSSAAGGIHGYHLSANRPASAPATATAAMARLYQIATNSGESSVQCSA